MILMIFMIANILKMKQILCQPIGKKVIKNIYHYIDLLAIVHNIKSNSNDWQAIAILSQANEGVPSDIKFTSAATNDSFMLKPEVRAAYAAWRDIRHQDEEEPEIQHIVGYYVSDIRGAYGGQDTACGVCQAG